LGARSRFIRRREAPRSLITNAGGSAIAIPVDLVDRLAVEDALARVAGELGAIDLVVNNHGSFRAFGPIWECDPDVWWQDVEINLRGTFHTCRVAVPAMLDRGKGRIVNLVGGGTGNSFPHGSGYASSKAAIMRFTECLNDTTKNRGVLAFAVDPGLVRTSMTELQLCKAVTRDLYLLVGKPFRLALRDASAQEGKARRFTYGG
jgi:NAD(P)-dependent dehydrogenase (short-subunit alcohol dehydrogenase family)